MLKETLRSPFFNPFYRILGSSRSRGQRPRELIKSLQRASEAIPFGEVACIFAEGEITRIGQLLPSGAAWSAFMKNVDAPIIPSCPRRVLGSPAVSRAAICLALPVHIPHRIHREFLANRCRYGGSVRVRHGSAGPRW